MEFDKYQLYLDAVQAPENDVRFYRETYKSLRGRYPRTFREDFCGTFAISCEWVRSAEDAEAYGVDLDLEPLDWGKKNQLPDLTQQQRERLHILNQNVLNPKLVQADVIGAANFSYFIFKTKDSLIEYFANARRTLNPDGLFIVDCFGGSACQEPNEEETELDDFTYYWDQDTFDPITHYAQFYIHFKMKNGPKLEQVFSYDWRMWTIPEIREAMLDAGFSRSLVYWEGTDSEGDGNGEFTQTEVGEPCATWLAYIVGIP